MEIKLKNIKNVKVINNLSIGTCFRFQGLYWMLTEVDEDQEYTSTCIGLGKDNAGEARTLGYDIEVTPIKFKLVEI